MAEQAGKTNKPQKVKRTGEDRILTAPTCVTLVRILLIPAFYILYIWTDKLALAVVLFVIAACSDWVDGTLARKTNTVTNLGKALDPFADRLLIIFGVLAVYFADRVPLWLMIAIFVRDLILLSLTAWLSGEYEEPLTVVYIGKVATWVVMMAFAMLMLGWPTIKGPELFESSQFPGFGNGTMYVGIYFAYIGIVLQWITAFIYLYRGICFGTTKEPLEENIHRKKSELGDAPELGDTSELEDASELEARGVKAVEDTSSTKGADLILDANYTMEANLNGKTCPTVSTSYADNAKLTTDASYAEDILAKES